MPFFIFERQDGKNASSPFSSTREKKVCISGRRCHNWEVNKKETAQILTDLGAQWLAQHL